MLDQPIHYDHPRGERRQRQRRALYVVFTVVVTGIVALAVVEATAGTPIYGVDTGTARASQNGIDLSVRFARVTRAQLSVPLRVRIRETGGFGGPVTIAISSAYLDLFDASNISPQPSSESSNESEVLMTFDPPTRGDALTVDWEMVARPSGWFANRAGVISVVDTDENPLVTASVHTFVRP